MKLLNTISLCAVLLFSTFTVRDVFAGEAYSLNEEIDGIGTKMQKDSVLSIDSTLSIQKLSFVQKVFDKQLYAKNIVGSLSFNVKSGDKDITLPGSLRMRKDEVIRLQIFIPLLGSEVVRLEFTPTYVLFIDRVHKEYVKADYSEVDFLKKQGLNFYSLQALFWNQLLLPGTKNVSESDLKKFDVNLISKNNYFPISYKQKQVNFTWNANKTSGAIESMRATFNNSAKQTSVLNWTYKDFKNVGVKQFPASQSFNLQAVVNKKVQSAEVNLVMNEVTTKSDWEAQTVVSDKYKNVPPTELFGKILNM